MVYTKVAYLFSLGMDINEFPSKLFSDIKNEKQRYEEQVIELENYINEEENKFPYIINDLNEKKQKALIAAKEAQENYKNRETEKLYQAKSQLLYKRDQMEKEIQNLQEYINSNDDTPQNEPLQKELIMLKSIAPIQIVSTTQNHIEGLITFGTPESTTYFGY